MILNGGIFFFPQNGDFFFGEVKRGHYIFLFLTDMIFY